MLCNHLNRPQPKGRKISLLWSLLYGWGNRGSEGPTRKQQVFLLPEPNLSQLPIKSPEHLPNTGPAAGRPAFQSGMCACRQVISLPGATVSSCIKQNLVSAGEDYKHAFQLQNFINCGTKNKRQCSCSWGIYRLLEETRHINRIWKQIQGNAAVRSKQYNGGG